MGDPHKWMLAAASSELDACESFFMMEGMAVNVPFGAIPIFIGVRPTVTIDEKMTLSEARKQVKRRFTVTLVVVPVFDAAFVTRHFDASQISRTLSAFLAAQPNLPQSWRENEGVKQWKSSLEAVVASSSGIAAVANG